MTDCNVADFDALETPLYEAALFFVEQPDGKRNLTELMRVVQFRQTMRNAAPKVLLYANANAGRRNPAQARKEGIMAGVFDYTACWQPGCCAFVEFKGYDAKGRPGKLSPAQVEFGNRMLALGHHVAAFFDPFAAVSWLREVGAPVAPVLL